LSHAATMFCSFCLCTLDQIEALNLQFWQAQDSAEVQAQAEAWLNQTTKAGHEALETKNGVQWTPMHCLPYWDPVNHVVLGFMHNFLEGILQHQLCSLWGIDCDKDESQKLKEIDHDEQWTDADLSESADDLDELCCEADEYEQRIFNEQNTPPMSASSSSSSGTASPTMVTPTETNITPYLYPRDDDDNGNDLDYLPVDPLSFAFTESELQEIRNCIQNITLPTWAQWPPINLGEPSHGRLKAHEYLSLFTCIFPIIMPEFWHSPYATENQKWHLNCFHHLVAATNIIASFETSDADADAYTWHYIQYQIGIQQIFPNHKSKPNHHYAMHNGAMLKYWGPLPPLSEFLGE